MTEPLTADSVAAQLLEMRLELTGFIRAMVGDAHTAEDIFQETCVKAVRDGCGGRFKDAKHVRRWAFVTAKNGALDVLRAKTKLEVGLSEAVIERLASEQAAQPRHWEPGQQDAAAAGRQLQALGHCLQGLTPRSRNVLALRYGEELPGIEVARRLNRRVDSIYKSLTRIYAQLRVCIRRRLQEDGV